MQKKILIAAEVADMLRVNRQRVYELVRTKQIPVIKLSERQYRFSSEEITRFLEEGGNRKEENDESK